MPPLHLEVYGGFYKNALSGGRRAPPQWFHYFYAPMKRLLWRVKKNKKGIGVGKWRDDELKKTFTLKEALTARNKELKSSSVVPYLVASRVNSV